MTSHDVSSGTDGNREFHLDRQAVAGYLAAAGVAVEVELRAELLSGGWSNPTYAPTDGHLLPAVRPCSPVDSRHGS